MTITLHDFHERFQTNVQEFIHQLDLENEALSASRFPEDEEPSAKRLKSNEEPPVIENIRKYLNENANEITYYDEKCLKNLAERVSQLTLQGNESVKLLGQQINALVSLKSKSYLKELPKDILFKTLLYLQDHKSAEKFLTSYKRLTGIDFFATYPDSVKIYLSSFDQYLSTLNKKYLYKTGIERDQSKLSLNFYKLDDKNLAENCFKDLLKVFPFPYIDTLALSKINISSEILKELYNRLTSINNITLTSVDTNPSNTLIKDLPEAFLPKELHLIKCEVDFSDIHKLLSTSSLEHLTLVAHLPDELTSIESHMLASDNREKLESNFREELESNFARLNDSKIERMTFSLIRNNPLRNSPDRLSSFFIEKIFTSNKFLSLKSFETENILSIEQVQLLLGSQDSLESIELSMYNWFQVVDLLARDPKGERIKKLFIDSKDPETMNQFTSSIFLKNVKQLIFKADDMDSTQDLERDINESIALLAKSTNLNSVEILDIAKANIPTTMTARAFAPDFSPLFEEDNMKSLKYLFITEDSFSWPKNLADVFDKQKFPNFENIQIPFEGENPTIFSSLEELNTFMSELE